MRGVVHRPAELFLLIKRTDKLLQKLALFVHGFRGNYLTTWGGLAEQLRYEADNKPVFDDWDYVFIGYDTKSVSTYLDIAQFIWTQLGKANQGLPPYRRRYHQFALFGHSLGTLGLRQSLCATTRQPNGMLAATKSVTFFGTPINGSPLAGIASLFYKVGAALKPNSAQLRMLKGWTESIHQQQKWPPIRIILGIDDKIVGYAPGELMSWAGDDPNTIMTGFDHSELVKPAGWNTAIIDYIEAGLA